MTSDTYYKVQYTSAKIMAHKYLLTLNLSYYHIRELRPYLDFKTTSTIATSIVHSKLDYSNSLYYNLPQYQIKKLQNIQNSLARAVTRTPKSSHITHCSQISTLAENKRTH